MRSCPPGRRVDCRDSHTFGLAGAQRDVARIARANRNHPSWYVWSAGNEFFNCQGVDPDPKWMAYILDAHRTFKGLDPTRFFVASDGADVFPTDIVTQAAKFAVGPGQLRQPFDGYIDEVAYFRPRFAPRTCWPSRAPSLATGSRWRL